MPVSFPGVFSARAESAMEVPSTSMCGIVGVFAKSEDVERRLGADLAAMLVQLSDRGPDSAGVAFYRDEAPSGSTKVTLYSADPREDWGAVAASLREALGATGEPEVRATHACIVVEAEADEVERWAADVRPDLRVMSAGSAIEVYKEIGRPEAFARQFALDDVRGTHALGHTRMATESRVTTEASHPFSTGLDVCLVHNGSLSNHNRLRLALRREGIPFRTDNDTEVAAGYLAWRMREGATLQEALEGCLDDLDGFYTFLVGTAEGFAVLRDPIACKPAVLAETDDWVAMASEYRAIAVLPGAEEARVWEPSPGVVYAWERVAA
jgi:methylamine---glutamate N-methyltransferase subunit A